MVYHRCHWSVRNCTSAMILYLHWKRRTTSVTTSVAYWRFVCQLFFKLIATYHPDVPTGCRCVWYDGLFLDMLVQSRFCTAYYFTNLGWKFQIHCDLVSGFSPFGNCTPTTWPYVYFAPVHIFSMLNPAAILSTVLLHCFILHKIT